MIQIRLWNDCYNNCKFCSLPHKTITPVNNKIKRIKTLTNITDNKISIIGGEFFEGQLKGCENEWLNMIKNIRCNELFITANLINQQYLLDETLNINPNILICTSYDTVGRFKNDQQKIDWLNRVNFINRIVCTVIPTDDIIHDKFFDKIDCTINLCEPHLGLEWYKSVNKSNYHEQLVHDNKLFNLAKRDELLQWIIQHPNIIPMKDYKINHFSNILYFDSDDNLIKEEKDRFTDTNFIADCGHPYFSRCYRDSDKCLSCDLEEL